VNSRYTLALLLDTVSRLAHASWVNSRVTAIVVGTNCAAIQKTFLLESFNFSHIFFFLLLHLHTREIRPVTIKLYRLDSILSCLSNPLQRFPRTFATRPQHVEVFHLGIITFKGSSSDTDKILSGSQSSSQLGSAFCCYHPTLLPVAKGWSIYSSVYNISHLATRKRRWSNLFSKPIDKSSCFGIDQPKDHPSSLSCNPSTNSG
jgi:hypothetical protein